jgi:hypothetical protein
MDARSYKSPKHCRFCTKPYHAVKPDGRDGFCSPACKMALARAYKAYVTRNHQAAPNRRLQISNNKSRRKRT